MTGKSQATKYVKMTSGHAHFFPSCCNNSHLQLLHFFTHHQTYRVTTLKNHSPFYNLCFNLILRVREALQGHTTKEYYGPRIKSLSLLAGKRKIFLGSQLMTCMLLDVSSGTVHICRLPYQSKNRSLLFTRKNAKAMLNTKYVQQLTQIRCIAAQQRLKLLGLLKDFYE